MDGWLDLDALIGARTVADGTGELLLDVPSGLEQGRSTWGGLATGSMTRAAVAAAADPTRRLRSLAAHLVGPLPQGTHRMRTEVLRRGRGTTTVGVRLGDDGDLAAHAVAVLGTARCGDDIPDGAGWLRVAPPVELAAGWRGVPDPGLGPPLAPGFVRHLDFRPLRGIPFTGDPSGETVGWIRPRARVGAVDDGLLAMLADAWPVAVMSMLDRPRPVATLSFTLDVPGDVAELPRDEDGHIQPLLHRGRLVAARDGYTVETRELWTVDGVLLSWNTQTVTVIR